MTDLFPTVQLDEIFLVSQKMTWEFSVLL
jgi:hypothetical protein